MNSYVYICIYVDIYTSFLYLLLYLENKNNNKNKGVAKTWLAGQSSCTLIIPKDFAKQYGLDEPSHVVVEGKANGILIRKLSLIDGEKTTE
jgi:hypothetical protein